MGFDFGVKPAIYLAVSPFGNRLMNQQTDDDIFPILNCWETFGDTMDVAVSGIGLCGCFSDSSVGPGTRYWSSTGWSGVNGIWTLNASNPGDPANTVWQGVIGTITIQEFDGSPTRPAANCDGTEIGSPVTVDIFMNVGCTLDENRGLEAAITASGGPIGGTAAQIFASTDFAPETWFQPGMSVPNVVVCTLDGSDYYVNVAADGSLIVALP